MLGAPVYTLQTYCDEFRNLIPLQRLVLWGFSLFVVSLRRTLFTIIATVALLTSFACKEAPPQPYVSSVSLTLEDVTVTDAVLSVHMTNPGIAPQIVLNRDGRVVSSGRMLVSDSTLVDDSLLPAHIYSYRAFRLIGGSVVDSSAPVTVTTMDTTSHEFTWEIDTLGDGNRSVLNDVAIINDTPVYAVEQVYVRDFTKI